MIKYELILPKEENGYCMFESELENDPLVLFHLTPKGNFDSITSKGFLSPAELKKTESLKSVSFAKKSSGCLANKGTKITEDLVVFAVKFDTLEKPWITVNPSDVHVYKRVSPQAILGYCELSKGTKIT